MELYAPDINGPIEPVLECGFIMRMIPMSGLISFHMYKYIVSSYQYVP